MNLEYLGRHFWDNVSVGNPSECWPWLKSTGSHGYGQTWDSASVLVTHRVAWFLTHGDPGTYIHPRSGLQHPHRILHRCPGGPNRLCCNPGHLAIGTDQDNADDRARDGNQARGEKMGGVRLKVDQVREARLLHGQGTPLADLARRYGVHVNTIRSAVNRSTWAHVE